MNSLNYCDGRPRQAYVLQKFQIPTQGLVLMYRLTSTQGRLPLQEVGIPLLEMASVSEWWSSGVSHCTVTVYVRVNNC